MKGNDSFYHWNRQREQGQRVLSKSEKSQFEAHLLFVNH